MMFSFMRLAQNIKTSKERLFTKTNKLYYLSISFVPIQNQKGAKFYFSFSGVKKETFMVDY